jgi:NAD(P)-dependent dehydrogenase (short-subunit alcohol dehydrogenase family)
MTARALNAAKVMLVTGASRGIGAEVAMLAARRGFAVGVNYLRDTKAAHEVVTRIERDGGRAIALQADVGDQAQVARMFAALDDSLGILDALVNNAGLLDVVGIDDASEERLLRSYRANVFGAAYCAREAVRRMSTARGGRGGTVVNLSSVASRLGGLGVAYAGTKGATDAFTLALANEVAAQGIRVTAVRPGLIDTTIHAASGGVDSMRERAKTAVPMRRHGAPSEVAEAVLWLASNEASYVHGTLLDVAGGR